MTEEHVALAMVTMFGIVCVLSGLKMGHIFWLCLKVRKAPITTGVAALFAVALIAGGAQILIHAAQRWLA